MMDFFHCAINGYGFFCVRHKWQSFARAVWQRIDVLPPFLLFSLPLPEDDKQREGASGFGRPCEGFACLFGRASDQHGDRR